MTTKVTVEVETITQLKVTKVERYGCYAPEQDRTFIVEDTLVNGELVKSECIGWYFGGPSDDFNEQYGDRDLVAEFN